MDQRTFCNHERAVSVHSNRPRGEKAGDPEESCLRLCFFKRPLLERCSCLGWPCVSRRLPRTAPDVDGPSASCPNLATILGQSKRWVICGSHLLTSLSVRARRRARNRSALLSTIQSGLPNVVSRPARRSSRSLNRRGEVESFDDGAKSGSPPGDGYRSTLSDVTKAKRLANVLWQSLIPLLFAPNCLYAQGMATPKPSPSALLQSPTKATPGKTSRSPVKHVTTPPNVTEGPPKTLSLKQAESIALRNAPTLGSAYFNAQAAKDVVKEARSQFFPQIEGDIEAVGTANAIRNTFGGTNNTVPQIRWGATGGLQNSLILSRESQGFNITQMIFDFGRTANLTAAAQFDALSQAQKAQLVRAQVVYRVDRAYLNVLKAEALLNVAQQTVADRQVLFDDIQALAQNKLKSDLDLSFAQANLDQAKQLLLQTENAVGEAFAELSAALGYKVEYRFELSEQALPPFPKESADSLTQLALRIRPDVIAMREQVLSAKKRALAERDARFPRIDAIGTIGRTPLGDPGVTGNYAAAGVNVSIPVFTGGLLSARQDEAFLRSDATQKALDDTETEVVSTVHSAWLDASTALKNIDVTEALAASSDQGLILAEAQYRAGQTSIIELSQAQLADIQAEIAAASAKYDYQILRAALDFQVGTIQYEIPKSAK
jgi:outer membrane protein